MVFLGAIRTYAYERYRKYEWVFEISIIIYALMTLLTWKDWTSILPFMGILSASVAMWQKNPRDIRYLSFIPTAFWFPYNFLSSSYMGMVGDLVTFSSVLIGVLRYDVLPYSRRCSPYREATEITEVNLV